MSSKKRFFPFVVALSVAGQGAMFLLWAQGALSAWCLSAAIFLVLCVFHRVFFNWLREHLGIGSARTVRWLVSMLALSGFGMAFGNWADWNFYTPPCLCCLFSPGINPLSMWLSLSQSLSFLGMLIGCLCAYGCCETTPRPMSWLPRAVSIGFEMSGMGLGMMLAAWAAAESLRDLGGAQRELGHLMMLVGMLLGASGARKTFAYVFIHQEGVGPISC